MKTWVITLSLIFLFVFNGLSQVNRSRTNRKIKYTENTIPGNKLLYYTNSLITSFGKKPLGFSYERNVLELGRSNEYYLMLGCLFAREKKAFDKDESYLLSNTGKMNSWKVEPYFKLYMGSKKRLNPYLFGSFVFGKQVIESRYGFDTTEYVPGHWEPTPWIFWFLLIFEYYVEPHYQDVTYNYYSLAEIPFTGLGMGVGINYDIILSQVKNIRLCFDLSLKQYKIWSKKYAEIPEKLESFNEKYQEIKSYHLVDRGHFQNFMPHIGIGLKF